VEIKCQLDVTEVFIADQQLQNHSMKYHRQQPPDNNTLELLMMGIVVPETC